MKHDVSKDEVQAVSKSAALYERALKIMPGGCSRNTILRKPHPVYAAYAKGCTITDIEGVKRIDFSNNMASLIHGHAHPKVVEAINEQVKLGTAYAVGTVQEIEYAEHLLSRSPNFEKIRFANSGTEAVMACLKAARAYTGRPKIAKVEGAYHGLYDYAEVSQCPTPKNWGKEDHPASVPVSHGTPQAALDDVVVIPFNDPEHAVALLDEHKDDVACVLIDLMPHRVGLVPVFEEFIDALQSWTQKNGALLVLDEVITFRCGYGGAQEKHNIHPDLTALGKIIGGGFPVGALAGRAEVMEVMNPLADKVLFPHSGTFSANPITMTAGRVSMEMYDQSAVKKLNRLSAYARDCISQAIQVSGIPACITGGGSMFRIQLKAEAPQNYRAAFTTPTEKKATAMLLDHLFDNGFILMNTCSGALSTAMTQKHVDMLAETLLEGFRKIRGMLRDGEEK
jgi:glutamate-1-semialdehyde 2,1-aminomutase